MADFDLIVNGNLVFTDRIVENGFVSYGYATVGRIHIDNMGGRWFRGDPTATWPISMP